MSYLYGSDFHVYLPFKSLKVSVSPICMYVCARFTFFLSGLSIVICIANYSKVDSIAKPIIKARVDLKIPPPHYQQR